MASPMPLSPWSLQVAVPMTKVYRITRDGLKAKGHKPKPVSRSGSIPSKRNTELLVRVLKKAI